MLVLLCVNILKDSIPMVQDINPDLHVIDSILHTSKSQWDELFFLQRASKLGSLALILKPRMSYNIRQTNALLVYVFSFIS